MPALHPCVLLPGFDGSGRLFEPFLAEARPPFEPRVVALPADVPRGYDELAVWLEPRLPTEPFVLLAESFSGPQSAGNPRGGATPGAGDPPRPRRNVSVLAAPILARALRSFGSASTLR